MLSANTFRRRLAAAIAAFLLVPPAIAQTQFITFGGGSTGGAFAIVAAGMARVIEKNVPDVRVTSRATSATIENTRLLGRKQIEFALAADNGPWAAAHSQPPFLGEKYDNIRYVATGYTSPFQIIVHAGAPIRTIADLKEKRVGLLSGITAQDWFPAIAEAYGITGKFKSFNLRAGELMDSLRDGNIDVAVYSGAAPSVAISDLATSKPLRFLPIEPEMTKLVRRTHPFFYEYPIKKGSYPGLNEDVPSIGNAILIVTHKDVPDALVYAVTKALMENREELKQIHPSAGEFNVEQAGRAVVVPPHPGAARYYADRGIKVPR